MDMSAPCGEDGQYLPNPYDCSKFYQCSNDSWVSMDCAPGTHFDVTLNVCNWPEDANCVPLPMPE